MTAPVLFKNMFSLAGKTAVITGGSGGLGLSVSKYLLQAGASLALIDNNLPKLEPAAADLSKWYNEPVNKVEYEHKQIISSWACDISDATQVESTIQAIRAHHAKPLDILINAAGYCENISAVEYPALNIKRIVDVNLNGSLFMAREFAKSLIADNHPGSIILVASMSGSIINYPQPQTPYNMTKAGVIHLAKSLASEWAAHNIRVNSLSPGYILTPLTKAIIDSDARLKAEWESKVPLGRMADPSEFAGPIIYMSSAASSYMTGHDLVVDGGYTFW
ncbi:Sps19p [Sugiyamaella lignohabitans]|uniref:D-arabinitol 2-dehydrogenase [ribulose-forming] n=1 Tax=Sugiyamaella lignohabitans TaxID=796027 RepID=A0A167BXQ3_9ASCO|nr:Sps19p [Sugiyamaella lignohabitans]ANB10955.1 Sps19p [Sugiyamaella lignohabitans]